MTIALRLARRGLGNVWPNPAVGCVLVAREGGIIGRGWTQPGGRPHAETEAIARASNSGGGDALHGACAYVSLEPCNHHGHTPPCTEALMKAGLGRVVVACRDPDTRVSGTGVARLRDAGIEVVEDVGAAAARAANAGYFMRQEHGRPLVTLKTATTLDGRIATRTGQSRWITGEPARARGHLMRARHDAVVVGLGTAMADDPKLDCRLPGLNDRSPVRVVFDSQARLPATARLVASARDVATWLVTTAAGDSENKQRLKGAGVEIVEVAAGEDGRVDPARALQALGGGGLTRLLVEGGAGLSGALLRAGLVDRLAWFSAPVLFGDDGLAAIPTLGVSDIGDAPRLHLAEISKIGGDVLETYSRDD